MAKPLRDISPKKPKEGEFSGKRSSTKSKMDISDFNAAPGNQDFAKKHEIEKHDYPYDADAAFTSGKIKSAPYNKQDAKVYEEIEQLDEVGDTKYGQKALKSYMDKASKDISKDNISSRKAMNRGEGLFNAADRIGSRRKIKYTSEESKMKCESCGSMYEGESCGCGKSVPEAKPGKKGMIADKKKLNEVLTKKTPTSKVISDFVHSDNPKFAGKSKKERIKMALGAYYGMHPEKSKKVEEELAMPMLEGGKKKTQKESAPGDTPIRFPSGNVGDTGRV